MARGQIQNEKVETRNFASPQGVDVIAKPLQFLLNIPHLCHNDKLRVNLESSKNSYPSRYGQ
jgi:hypothetical protein